ncbi:MAG: hypothetical protein JWR29_2037, partial [Tardiphaga sp.]|nr:hypothetical protein [Tardiphaga sp.]
MGGGAIAAGGVAAAGCAGGFGLGLRFT